MENVQKIAIGIIVMLLFMLVVVVLAFIPYLLIAPVVLFVAWAIGDIVTNP